MEGGGRSEGGVCAGGVGLLARGKRQEEAEQGESDKASDRDGETHAKLALEGDFFWPCVTRPEGGGEHVGHHQAGARQVRIADALDPVGQADPQHPVDQGRDSERAHDEKNANSHGGI